jgi:hypothetical protein
MSCAISHSAMMLWPRFGVGSSSDVAYRVTLIHPKVLLGNQLKAVHVSADRQEIENQHNEEFSNLGTPIVSRPDLECAYSVRSVAFRGPATPHAKDNLNVLLVQSLHACSLFAYS